MRVDPVHLSTMGGGPQLDEAARERARMTLLRAQAATYNASTNIYAFYEAPPGLEHFDVIADSDPSKLHLLHQAFVDAVRRCEATAGSLSVQRHVYWIARKLLELHSRAGDQGLARVYIETARELLTDPGYQQLLRCAMADLARGGGDLAAAEAWLTTCDPRPALLDLDSDFRMSRARIAIEREEWTAVLELVGETRTALPLEPSSVPQVALFRVLALEATGSAREAEAELTWLSDQVGHTFLRGWIERMPYLSPCLAVWTRCNLHAGPSAEPGPPSPSLPPPPSPPPLRPEPEEPVPAAPASRGTNLIIVAAIIVALLSVAVSLALR